MSTPVFVDPNISTHADGAQSSRVPVPLPEDPYEATRTVRMAMRVPPAMSSGLSASMAEVAAISESAFHKRFRSSYESSPSLSPPELPSRKHYRGTSELVEDSKEDDDEDDKEIEESLDSNSVSKDAEDEGPTVEDEDPAAGDGSLAAGDEGPSMDDESHGLDDESRGLDDEGYSVESDRFGLEDNEEEAIPRGQQQGAPVVKIALSAPLGLGYEALRHRELALEEDHVYSTFEVGQDSEDDIVYIVIPVYPPPAPLVQTPPSPEWTSGSILISPLPSVVPSPISSPMIPRTLGAQVEMQGGLIRDYAVQLEELSPALFGSPEYEHEKVAVTFGAIWRPVLALESWIGQTDA
ncbi:hypothetical protein Tco_0910553 [Tanacetum coccineum]|uniref:Uncharacterized protein n=1 Tax=Tanacetum coccineum TaxID=301880 RepID=A0ABQ5CTN5_9ASTR